LVSFSTFTFFVCSSFSPFFSPLCSNTLFILLCSTSNLIMEQHHISTRVWSPHYYWYSLLYKATDTLHPFSLYEVLQQIINCSFMEERVGVQEKQV
jgi:hypothetical protein